MENSQELLQQTAKPFALGQCISAQTLPPLNSQQNKTTFEFHSIVLDDGLFTLFASLGNCKKRELNEFNGTKWNSTLCRFKAFPGDMWHLNFKNYSYLCVAYTREWAKSQFSLNGTISYPFLINKNTFPNKNETIEMHSNGFHRIRTRKNKPLPRRFNPSISVLLLTAHFLCIQFALQLWVHFFYSFFQFFSSELVWVLELKFNILFTFTIHWRI